jgi:hypothetical protein
MVIVTQLSVLFGVLFVLSGCTLWAVVLCHGMYDTVAFVRFAFGKSKYSARMAPMVRVEHALASPSSKTGFAEIVSALETTGAPAVRLAVAVAPRCTRYPLPAARWPSRWDCFIWVPCQHCIFPARIVRSGLWCAALRAR